MHKRQSLQFLMVSHPMVYRDQLHPWCIIWLLPNAHSIIVKRFRRRCDAEAQIKVLRYLRPNASYQIVFDAQQKDHEE